MKKLLLICFILTVPFLALTQTLNGRVSNPAQQPLQGASVSWLGFKKGTVTNEKGEFEIKFPKQSPFILLVSFAEFKTDTLQIADTSFVQVSLKERPAMSGVTIQSNQRPSYIASFPIKTEVISTLELKKAACCDLAGCFETQTTVQPQTTNIITNSKELRILGLSGIYNQVLVDGFPQIQGLSYTYGISSIPGTLVENIWVAKGANSVLQGFESISGQINVITKEPEKTDRLLLNAYINSFGEKHFNINLSSNQEKWNHVTAFHMVQPASRIDKDSDNFLDLPLLTRYMISNRWKKGDESKWGWSTQFNLRYLNERRIGGQVNFNYASDKGTTNSYGQVVDINQPEFWFKTSYRVNDVHRFALYASGFYHSQQSWFGVTNYDAEQLNGYLNVQHEFSYGKGNVLKSGFSNRYMNLKEDISFTSNLLNRTYAGEYHKKEKIPGIFAENTLTTAGGRVTWIAGLRADHHNRFGWEITPRTLLKFDATDNFTIRASIGKGWRTANIFSENTGLLVSSRDILFAETLKPEKAVNMGVNLTHKFRKNEIEAYYSLDFYRTTFQNQIFPDYDSDPTKAILRNFGGESVSNGFQAEAGGTFYKRVSAKIGYVFLDVYQKPGTEKQTLPFNPKHRLNSAISFMPLSRKWHLDGNVHWYGRQRLPGTKANPPEYQYGEESKPYGTVSLQFTHTIKRFEFYAGAENIFNFRQLKPIISWQEPFGKYFDTQFTWGPTRGREMYVGVRFIVKKP